MVKRLHNVMSDKEEKLPKPKKRHIDALKNIQFVPQDHERYYLKKLVSQTKKLKPRDPSEWITLADIAEETIRKTLDRGLTIISTIRPANNYITKGRRINVYLKPEEWEQIEDLALQNDVSIKKMCYSLFEYSFNSVIREVEQNDTALSVGTNTERKRVTYETESAGVLL